MRQLHPQFVSVGRIYLWSLKFHLPRGHTLPIETRASPFSSDSNRFSSYRDRLLSSELLRIIPHLRKQDAMGTHPAIASTILEALT